ncbi:MAG TPA: hypothetical protein VIK01_28895 [Polyangiaceae bacterium]
MTRKHWFGPRLTRSALFAAVLAALAGLGSLGARELSVESAQAQSFVAQGRSELQQGRRATAIVSFERAKLLAPRADFVRAALNDASVRDVETATTHAVNWIAPREWSFLLITFGWVAGLSLAFAIARPQNGRVARGLALVAGVLFVLGAAGVVESTISTRALRVVSSATGVLLAPYQGAGATADLPPGVVVAAGSRYGEFIQVCGPDGTHGWVTANSLEPVVGT